MTTMRGPQETQTERQQPAEDCQTLNGAKASDERKPAPVFPNIISRLKYYNRPSHLTFFPLRSSFNVSKI